MVNAIPTDAGHPATMEDPKDRLLREAAKKLHDERERRKLDQQDIARLTRENIALRTDLDAAVKRAELAEARMRSIKSTRPLPYSGDSLR